MSTEVNMSRALMSPTYAKQLYLEYRLNGTGLTAFQAGQIEAQYSDECQQWLKDIKNHDSDVTKYEIDDSSWDEAYKNGKQQGKDLTGYNNSFIQKSAQIGNTAIDTAASVGEAGLQVFGKEVLDKGGKLIIGGEKGAAKVVEKAGEKAVKKASKEAIKKAGEEALEKAGKTAAEAGKEAVIKAGEEALGKTAEQAGEEAVIKAGEEALGKTVEKAGEEAVEKAGEEAIKETGKEAGKKALESVFILAACTLDAAQALKYRLFKPNETQHEALTVAGEDIGNQQSKSLAARDSLSNMSEDVINLADEADLGTLDANNTMADNKTDYDFYARSYEYLQHRITAVGMDNLLPEELELLKECTEHMKETSNDVQSTQTEAEEAIQAIHDEANEYQQCADDNANNISEVDGTMAYIEGFDDPTWLQCNIEAGVQGLNAGMAGLDAYKAGAAAVATGWCGLGIAYGAAAAVAGAAAVSGGLAAAEQAKMANDAGTVKDNRTATQELNAETLVTYENTVSTYATAMEGIEGEELIVPENMETPDDVTAEATPTQTTNAKKDKDKEDRK